MEIMDISRDPILGVKSGTVVYANPSALAFFGNETVGVPSGEVLPNHILSEKGENFLVSAVINGQSMSVHCIKKGDMRFYFCISQEKTPISPLITASLRASLLNLRMAADQVLSRISLSFDPKLETYSSMLYHNYFSLLRLISHLEIVSDAGNLVFSPAMTDVTELCSKLVSEVSRLVEDRGVKISFECKESPVLAVVDGDKLERLLLNLLSNSLKHTKKGGEICVSLKRLKNQLILSVDDNGTGIPPETLGTVFERYKQNVPLTDLAKGAGLGLCISKAIAELHGGTLIIESREGQGTSVRITLAANIKPSTKFRSTEMSYARTNMNNILTELSGVLGHEAYNKSNINE
jgi:two-component sensor histidine kinase